MKILAILLAACVLTACAAAPEVPSLPPDPVATGAADCAAIPVSSPETTAAENAPPVPEPLILPDGMESDLTDPAAAEILAQIAALAAREKLSAVCMAPDGSLYFAVDPDSEYPTASTVKAFYCQFLLAFGADLTEQLTLTAATRTSTSGMLTSAAVGQSFSVETLMEYAVRYSDNMAYRLLFERFGAKDFNAYVRALGLDAPILPSSYEFTQITARRLAACTAEILRYAEENDDPRLIGWMKNTTYNAAIPAGTEYETAHKYGFEGGNLGFLDTAVVFADPPYILTVMSHIDPNAEGTAPFVEITRLSDALHAVLYEK